LAEKSRGKERKAAFKLRNHYLVQNPLEPFNMSARTSAFSNAYNNTKIHFKEKEREGMKLD